MVTDANLVQIVGRILLKDRERERKIKREIYREGGGRAEREREKKKLIEKGRKIERERERERIVTSN